VGKLVFAAALVVASCGKTVWTKPSFTPSELSRHLRVWSRREAELPWHRHRGSTLRAGFLRQVHGSSRLGEGEAV